MRKKKNHLLTLFILVFSALAISCSNEDGKARFEVRLTDAPGDFEEVNVDIQGIEINSSANESGWVAMTNVKTGVYNLLDFTNGVDTLLATMEVPSGKVNQIRLILGENNSVKKDGEVFPLKTPSAQQSGLKLKINANLTEGITYRLLLDFDANRSVVSNGQGYNLKPVIRAVSEAQTGAIQGVITPKEAQPTVIAIIGSDSVSTNSNVVTGNFMIKGLKAGTYKVVFIPKEGFSEKSLESVVVTVGQATKLDTLYFQ